MPADYKTLLGLVREFVVEEKFLREIGADDLCNRAIEAIKPSEPKNDPAILHTHAPAECCSKYILRAARKGELDLVIRWACPNCGADWTASLAPDGTRHWTPQEAVAIFRR